VNAVKLAESQVELLKDVVATNPDSIFGAGTPASYCITSTGTVLSSTNASCKMDASGTATTAEPAYNLAITRSGNTFTVNTSWTSIRGGGNNSVQMKYRAYDN
jgi:hypothetical protein